MNQIFDITRASALLKLNLTLNRKPVVLALAGFFGFVFVTSFFVANSSPFLLDKMHTIFYYILIFGGVGLVAGRSFWHLNTTERSIAHLSLPASTFEKYFIPWLLSGIAWIVFAILSYLVSAALINGIWSAMMGFEYEFFNPFTKMIGPESVNQVYKPYFLIHATFFLGAAAFRTHAIPKTLLTGFLVNSLFTFVNMLVLLILFGSFGDFNFTINHQEGWQENFKYFFEVFLPKFVEYSFVYVIPVVFYIAAFFKLKEREV